MCLGFRLELLDEFTKFSQTLSDDGPMKGPQALETILVNSSTKRLICKL